MKKILLAIGASLAMVSVAFAAGVAGGANVGGQLTTFSGNTNGSIGANASGNVVSAAETDGFGSSNQAANSHVGASAGISSNMNIGGANVGVDTAQFSNVNTVGNVSGNSPINVGTSIANGSDAIGKAGSNGAITSNFNSNAVGADLALGGSFQVQAIGE